MRRQLATILGLSGEAGLAWLQYARLCRSTGEEGAGGGGIHRGASTFTTFPEP